MKKHIYILSAVFTAMQVSAQITLTQSANAPASGDVQTTKYLDSIAALDKTAGTSKTWDYTGSVTNSTVSASSVSYTTASSIPGASMFTSAGANVAATDSSEFYISTSTALEMMGNMQADGSYTFLSNTMKVMQFPFTYPNSFTDTYAGTLSINGFGSFSVNGNLSITADGYGTVILPSAPSNLSFSNVLRVKMNNTMTIAGTGTISAVTGTIITTDYLYFKSGTKNPFFQISYQYRDIPAFGAPSNSYSISYDAALPVSVQEIAGQTPSIFFYPNPAKDEINIQLNQSDYKRVSIFDIQGKRIKEYSLSSAQLDIQAIKIDDLKEGLYFIHLTGSEKGLSDVVYRFIKE